MQAFDDLVSLIPYYLLESGRKDFEADAQRLCIEQYEKIAERYRDDEQKTFRRIFDRIMEIIDHDPGHDVLGELYMSIK